MSHLPPLPELPQLHTLFKDEVDRYTQLLINQYPKHGTRKPLSWTFTAWELQVSEMTVRNYIEQKKLKDLKIPTIAEFIVMEDIRERITEDKQRAKQAK